VFNTALAGVLFYNLGLSSGFVPAAAKLTQSLFRHIPIDTMRLGLVYREAADKMVIQITWSK